MKTACPDCGQEINMGENVVVGDVVECGHCGTELEVVSLEPLQVRIIEEEK